MRTYILTDEVQAIGRAGEQGGISVAVDVTAWQAEYSDGIGAMLCERPDGRQVPLGATVTDNLLVAVLPQECTSRPGQYTYKATWSQAGVLRISHSYNALILTTDNGRGLPPDRPGTPKWATEIFIKAEQIDAALDAAMQMSHYASDYSALQTKVSALMREDYWDSGKVAEMKYAGYVEGYYRDYNTGKIVENADYSYSGNIHILPYSDFKIVNANGDVHVTYWNAGGGFISGELRGSTHGDLLTIPESCDSVVLSYATSERNQIALTYINNILVVGVGRQFATINAAVAVANDGDTILVYPGIYNESVDAYAKKVHIRGISKSQCILTYSADNYTYPPLQMAKGSVSNMTIYASWSGDATNPRAYCVHIDSDYERGERLTFDNVDFVTDRGDCVGIGTRTDFDLKFANCLFHAKATAVTGCIYNHDSESESEGINGYNVYENQNVEYINCTMINESTTYTIVLQSQERLDSCCKITFIGNQIIQPNNSGNTIAMTLWQDRHLTNTHYLGSSDFILTGISGLNTDPVLGYTNLLDVATVAETQTYLGLT